MAELPLVTIVTPSFNQAEYLEEALRSVRDQDYPHIEHIVVDGGSTDGSVEIIRSFEDGLSWWTSAPDGGQAAALNHAFGRAGGEILGWLNSDDVLLPGAVSAGVEALAHDPEVMLVYGANLAVDEHGNPLAELEGFDLDAAAMVRTCRNWVVQPGSLFRRKAWETAGPFEERSYYYFDFEFVLRLLFSGAKTSRLDRRLAIYRIHPGSKTGGGQALEKARDHLRLYRTILSQPNLPDDVRAVQREARSRSSFAAAEFFLAGGDRHAARRELARGAWLSPAAISRGTLRLVAQAFLPRPVVEHSSYFKVVG